MGAGDDPQRRMRPPCSTGCHGGATRPSSAMRELDDRSTGRILGCSSRHARP